MRAHTHRLMHACMHARTCTYSCIHTYTTTLEMHISVRSLLVHDNTSAPGVHTGIALYIVICKANSQDKHQYARVRNRVWMHVCACVRVYMYVRTMWSMDAFMCVHVCAHAHVHIHVHTHKLRHLKYTLVCCRSWCMITRVHQGCIQAWRCI